MQIAAIEIINIFIHYKFFYNIDSLRFNIFIFCGSEVGSNRNNIHT